MSIMKKVVGLAIATSALQGAFSEEMKTLPLWPEGVPAVLGTNSTDNPIITVHRPPAGKANGVAVLICPGGGYGGLCSSYEGHDIAKWLNGYGVTGIVLQYRLNPYHHPVPLQDAQRAMRLVRLNAPDWQVDPKRIGVMGFSAGGHLAATLGTHYDAGNSQATNAVERQGCRPAFMILVYPVITMGDKGHAGSMVNLLGPNPTQAQREEVSNELHVTRDTPMAFLAHSIKDSIVPVENSRLFRDALKAQGVPVNYCELHTGDHGLGCGQGEQWALWQAACLKWMQVHGLASEN